MAKRVMINQIIFSGLIFPFGWLLFYPPAVELFLFKFALFGLIVLRTSFGSAAFAMRLAATEWTPEVISPAVARMGDEQNPAMLAAF